MQDNNKINNRDAQLLAGIARQSHDDFAEFVSQYMLSIMNFVHRFFSSKSQAEDIAQDVFLKVWQNAKHWKHNEAGSARAWLYRIAYNRCIDLLRQNKPQTDDTDNLSTDITPEKILLNDSKHKQLSAAIASLPERQRTALSLCTFQGLSNKDAAKTLAISVDALESLLSRARRQLRKKLTLETENEMNGGRVINE